MTSTVLSPPPVRGLTSLGSAAGVLPEPADHGEPLREARGGLRIVQVRDDLARVTRANGEVLGYVERHDDPQGDRFRAKRFIARQRRFVEIGDFWSRGDATDCFRFA
jgi:hypothetical protein